MARGDILTVLVDSPMALETVSRWAQKAGHRLVRVSEPGAGQWEIAIEKITS